MIYEISQKVLTLEWLVWLFIYCKSWLENICSILVTILKSNVSPSCDSLSFVGKSVLWSQRITRGGFPPQLSGVTGSDGRYEGVTCVRCTHSEHTWAADFHFPPLAMRLLSRRFTLPRCLPYLYCKPVPAFTHKTYIFKWINYENNR